MRMAKLVLHFAQVFLALDTFYCFIHIVQWVCDTNVRLNFPLGEHRKYCTSLMIRFSSIGSF